MIQSAIGFSNQVLNIEYVKILMIIQFIFGKLLFGLGIGILVYKLVQGHEYLIASDVFLFDCDKHEGGELPYCFRSRIVNVTNKQVMINCIEFGCRIEQPDIEKELSYRNYRIPTPDIGTIIYGEYAAHRYKTCPAPDIEIYKRVLIDCNLKRDAIFFLKLYNAINRKKPKSDVSKTYLSPFDIDKISSVQLRISYYIPELNLNRVLAKIYFREDIHCAQWVSVKEEAKDEITKRKTDLRKLNKMKRPKTMCENCIFNDRCALKKDRKKLNKNWDKEDEKKRKISDKL